MQKVRQKFPEYIQPSRGRETYTGVLTDIPDPFITWWAPYARRSASSYNSREARYRKSPASVSMPRSESAHESVPGALPCAGLMGTKESIIFVEGCRHPVADGLANAVVANVAGKSPAVCAPSLAPFPRSVRPLTDSRPRCFAKDRQRPNRIGYIKLEPSLLRQRCWLGGTQDGKNLVAKPILAGGTGRRCRANSRPIRRVRLLSSDCRQQQGYN